MVDIRMNLNVKCTDVNFKSIIYFIFSISSCISKHKSGLFNKKLYLLYYVSKHEKKNKKMCVIKYPALLLDRQESKRKRNLLVEISNGIRTKPLLGLFAYWSINFMSCFINQIVQGLKYSYSKHCTISKLGLCLITSFFSYWPILNYILKYSILYWFSFIQQFIKLPCFCHLNLMPSQTDIYFY